MQASNGLWNQQQLLTFLYPSNTWLRISETRKFIIIFKKPALTNSKDRILPEMLTVAYLVMEFSVFYGTWMFITVLTRVHLNQLQGAESFLWS
jgi:hypothetical protein